MSRPIEDYAIIGDCRTAALVSREGSIDWLCLPRFDSGACFASLLGSPDNGRWLLAPKGNVRRVVRSYRGDTLILETEFVTDEGIVSVTDFMPLQSSFHDLVRIVEGKQGSVAMAMEIVFRLDYGLVVPWVRKNDDGLIAVAGPDALHLRADVELHGENFKTLAEFTLSAGERRTFVLTWFPSHKIEPEQIEPDELLASTHEWWSGWSSKCTYRGPWRDAVLRSLITLKAMTYAPTGGTIAALTTSLPECVGGDRNWDYRLCWLRDATFMLYALLGAGFTDEACAWRDWLLRAVAGKPDAIQPVYGVAGERWLPELEIDWLPGYAGSGPVRIGNLAHVQLQLDVYGELIDTLHQARLHGLRSDKYVWRLEKAFMEHLESIWTKPDNGIWEIRAEPRHFTHSKVMAWVAADRAVRSIERFKLEGPVERWRRLRDRIHEEVCRDGFNPAINAFTQSYGSTELDASLLVLPQVGFLPPDDPRIRGTVEAIEKRLMRDGFVMRYRATSGVDGIQSPEGAFLLCTFWLADAFAMLGRKDDALEIFERLLAIRNDVGLLSEEYDPVEKRFLGNFPQAFSHVALVNTAQNLADHGPSADRPHN
jgi:GH15 family glucan-1,4-alpha-glucosidase